MILRGYDEDGNLAFKQGPFTIVSEALSAFAAEKCDAEKNGIFLLTLGEEVTPRHRVEGVNFFSFAR